MGVVAVLVTCVVVTTTDEGAPWARRIGMIVALVPVAAALGTFAAGRVARARGELSALAAVGVAPLRARRGAVLGGVVLGLAGPAVAASPRVDLDALFPAPLAARAWSFDGSALREEALG